VKSNRTLLACARLRSLLLMTRFFPLVYGAPTYSHVKNEQTLVILNCAGFDRGTLELRQLWGDKGFSTATEKCPMSNL
jgi:hypothetical protein